MNLAMDTDASGRMMRADTRAPSKAQILKPAARKIRRMSQAPASDLNRWSTDHVDPADRFDYWRESLAANLIGDAPEAPPEHRRNFSGAITRIPVADTGVMQLRMRVSQLRTERTAKHVRDTPGDGVFLFRAENYDMNFQFHDRPAMTWRSGQMVIGGLDRVRSSVAMTPGAYHCDVLRLPSASFEGVVRNSAVLDPRVVAQDTGADALLHSFFDAFMRELPRLSAEDRATALATLTGLATLVLRRDRRAEEPGRAAVQAARLQAARDHIARYATHPGLSPAAVAAALGISVRQLHALFEPSGQSFSQRLREERVARATQALQADPTRTVAEIAFGCGFDSLPTFYRAFRAAAGMAPGDLRTGAPVD